MSERGSTPSFRPTPNVPTLMPTGTARAAFLGIAASEPGEALPAELGTLLAARDVPAADLVAAWEVARWAAEAPLPERGALACLVLALLDAEASGGTVLSLSALGARLARLGVPAELAAGTEALAQALMSGTASPAVACLFGAPGARRPFVLDGGWLQSERLWAMEDQLGTVLGRRLKATSAGLAPPEAIAQALAAAESVPGSSPISDEQRAALRGALAGSLTLIAGGPGTGKTSIVVAILRVLVRLGVPADSIALAAPTGRAAQRMKESVDAALARITHPATADALLLDALADGTLEATTLHRLIGTRPGRDRPLEPPSPIHHQGWRLPARVILVDEASMIDLALMRQLAAAVADDAHLVLLGDAEQLPSVETGAVFRDLLAGAPSAAFRLTRSHRMNPDQPEGAAILALAGAVNRGARPDLGPVTCDGAAALRFSGVEALPGDDLGRFLDRWHAQILGADEHLAAALDHRCRADSRGLLDDGPDAAWVGALLAAHARARILCLTRTAGHRTSAHALNRAMHARVQAAALGRGVSPALATAAYVPGEPVLLLANDHARGLFNGDVGVVLRVHADRGEHLGVAFARGGAIEVHRLDELAPRLGPAFALTVHKAQGSEYDRVALVLPESDAPLLSREILYTALTRARLGVTIIGDPALFALGAGRTLDRASTLSRRLGTSRS